MSNNKSSHLYCFVLKCKMTSTKLICKYTVIYMKLCVIQVLVASHSVEKITATRLRSFDFQQPHLCKKQKTDLKVNSSEYASKFNLKTFIVNMAPIHKKQPNKKNLYTCQANLEMNVIALDCSTVGLK